SQLTREFPNIHISVFGHMGDSNIHLCVSAGAAEEWVKERITTIIYGEVRRFYGAISAEHGIGILKRDYLHYTRNQQEIELMRAIKRTLDPNWILNPGKIFAAEARRL
ncbi:MAG: FAD-binding oxidoreductase, partial [Mesorhizobium sp.]